MFAAVATFLEYVEMGGYVMVPLILAAAALWYGIGIRLVVLRPGTQKPVRYLIAAAERGELAGRTGFLERAAAAGVQVRRRFTRTLRSHLDEAYTPFLRTLRQHRVLIRAVVASAPLLGLLGTVSGMIETFASLGDMTLFSQSGGIAGGISQALLTTQFGLAIAIPGLIVRGLLERRQALLEGQLEQLKELLCAGEVA